MDIQQSKRHFYIIPAKTNVLYTIPKKKAREIIDRSILGPDETITNWMLFNLYKEEVYRNVLKDNVVFIIHICAENPIKTLGLKLYCRRFKLGHMFVELGIMRKIISELERTPGVKLLDLMLYGTTILVHADLSQRELSSILKGFTSLFDSTPDVILLGAILDKHVYTADHIFHLASIKSLPEHYSEIVQTISAPAVDVLMTLQTSPATLCQILHQHPPNAKP